MRAIEKYDMCEEGKQRFCIRSTYQWGGFF